MNPKEFSWEEDQTVTVTNPTGSDYPFKVHNKDYMVKGGQTVKMPGYIAWVYVYGLASLLAQADKQFSRWNEEGFRNQYYDQVVIGADDVVQEVVVQPQVEAVTFDEPNETVKPEARRGRPPRA